MAIPEMQPDTPVESPSVSEPDLKRKRPWLSPLNQRRWRNFRRNQRAYWSLIIFGVIFFVSLFAEFLVLW